MAGIPGFASPATLAGALALAAAGLLASLLRLPPGYHRRGRRAAIGALRATALVAAALVAGGPLLRDPAAPLRVAVLVDESASMGGGRSGAAADHVERLRRALPPAARLSVTRFASPRPHPGEPAGEATTDIEAALRAVAARLSAGDDNRVILLSDGAESAGNALRAVPDLRRAGAKIFPVALGGAREPRVLLQRATAPRRVVPGERFEIRLTVAHAGSGAIAASLWREGRRIAAEEVPFEGAGEREIVFEQTAEPEGALSYHATAALAAGGAPPAAPAGGRDVEVAVETAPEVLYLAGEPDEAAALAGLLRRAGLPVDLREPADWLLERGDPPPRSVIVLDNVPASELGVAGAARIEALVREGGVGLLAIGGQGTFGADPAFAALERALPAVAGAPGGGEERPLALVIVVDTSLSMFYHGRAGGRFHRSAVPRKIDAAKTAVLEMARALRPGDHLGLLDSKDVLTWRAPLGPPGDPAEFERRVMGMRALGGGIFFYSSVREAGEALRRSTHPLRMMMVVCDTNDVDQLKVEEIGESAALVGALAAEGITLSIFSIGFPTDKDVPFLKGMAALGRGDFYLVSNVASLPRYLRTEYAKKTGEAIREEDALPLIRDFDPLLKGIDPGGIPAVRAMHLLAARRGAEQLLVAPSGAPLLASWHYGRGRSAVFASDSGARWAPAWTSWHDAERFWRQLIFALAPRERPAAGEARAAPEPGGGRIRIAAAAADGAVPGRGFTTVRFERGEERVEAPLERTGLDGYAASAAGLGPGLWRLEVRGGEGGRAAGAFEIPPPAGESAGDGEALLEALARETGGEAVADAAAALRPATGPPLGRRPDPVPWLLVTAMLALFGEVVLRR